MDSAKHGLTAVVAVAAVSMVMAASPAAAFDHASGQDFEIYPVGTAEPFFIDGDSGFGYFHDGTVEAPGITVDASFMLEGDHVYYGSNFYFSNMNDNENCCGYYRMEMLVTAPNGVTIEYWVNNGRDGNNDRLQKLAYSETIYGVFMHHGWGEPWNFWQGGYPPNPLISTIKWISVDGSPIAIDNVVGVGEPAIPEPATWALLIAGFGLVGMAARRRKALA